MPRTTTGAGPGSFIGQGAIKQRRGQFGLFGRVGTAATAASVGQLVAQSVGQLISLSVCQLGSLSLSALRWCRRRLSFSLRGDKTQRDSAARCDVVTGSR